MRQLIDLRTLIEQCTGYLRDAGFCERSVVEFNRYMRFGLLAYAEENGITSYTTSLGNEYIAFLKHKKCFTAGRKKALFTFHSFAVRGMVAFKRKIVLYDDICTNSTKIYSLYWVILYFNNVKVLYWMIKSIVHSFI